MAGRCASPHKFMRGLKAHRKMRERSILERLKRGDRTIAEMVAQIYRDTDPGCTARPRFRCWRISKTWSRAASSTADGDPSIDANYALSLDDGR